MIVAHRSLLRRFSWIVTTSFLAACGASPGGPGAEGAAGSGAGAAGAPAGAPTETQIEKLASGYPTFSKINGAPFVTQQHQGNPLVNVYANAVAETTYRGLKAGGAVHFADGAMLVKEMLDGAGGPPILTVMYKMPAGYDAANGDWWRGRLNADGSATAPDLVGKVGFCISCHAAAAKTDGAFGVPGG